MKNLLATILILAVSAHGCGLEKFPDFMNLDKATAAATARKQAEADFVAGKYRILIYGEPGPPTPAEQRLAKKGVQAKAIAGCKVSEGILEGARVYNEIMREKLKAKLGTDVFDENAEPQKQPVK